MTAERVLDASVLGAALFEESATSRARETLRRDFRFVAPDLLFVEMASLASSKVRRQIATPVVAERALDGIGALIWEVIPAVPHYRRAFALAARHGVSAYDGLYLAVAEARGVPVITADERLLRRARDAGLSALVEPLG